MAARYRTSIKIGKGVKVNLSGSGPSVTLGGRGSSVNVSGRGVRVSGKVPGTNVSYSQSVGSQSSRRSSRSGAGSSYGRSGSSGSRQQVPIPPFTVCMNDKGQTWVEDERGREIEDASLLRKIKAHPDYKRQKDNLERQRQAHLEDLLSASEEENEKFLNIHKYAPVVDTEKEFTKELNAIKQETYSREIFPEQPPVEADLIRALEAEAESQVRGMFWNRGKLRQEYVDSRLAQRMEAARTGYDSRKAAFEAEQDQLEAEVNESLRQEYEAKKEYLTLLIQGDEEVVPEAISEWISSCQLPVEINLEFDWDPEKGIIYLDVDLPEIEDLPDTRMVQMENGNLKEKNKTQKTLREEYSILVFGLAVFITTNVFNISPAIQKILISGYTQRRNKDGELQDDYIYSLKFFREVFEKRDVTGLDPVEVCMSSENRCNQTTTGLFKAIKPYEVF